MESAIPKITSMTIDETSKWLEERDNFLILTHIRPDGDTLGSACGLCAALREAGKTVYVLYNPQVTRRYADYVEQYMSDSFVPEYVISADIAAEGLFPKNALQYTGKIDLAIDHHPSYAGFAQRTLLDSKSAACGEVIYELLKHMYGSVSKETATLLFIAITTDTGCFRYANTTAKTLRIASELVEVGAPGADINKRLFRTKSQARVNIESEILNNLEYSREGKIATVVVTQEMIKKAGADEDDMEDVAAIHGQIEGVVVSITIREQEDFTAKISVRTNRFVDAGAICGILGGGGHAMAAGVSVDCGVWDAKEKILKAVDEVWK